LVPVQRPQEIEEKIQKNFILGPICTGPNTLFWDLKKIRKNFWKHLLPGTTFEKKEKKT
jgi:hypothetical protein